MLVWLTLPFYDFCGFRSVALTVCINCSFFTFIVIILPKSQLSRLQQIQNSLARTVVKAPKSCHITPILRSLHWLKITERVEYKLLSLTYTTKSSPPTHLLHIFIISSLFKLLPAAIALRLL